MDELKVGDVVWKMRFKKTNEENEWYCDCNAILKVDSKSYYTVLGGFSKNCLGIFYFASREECLRNWEDIKEGKTLIDLSLYKQLYSPVEVQPTELNQHKIYINSDMMINVGILKGFLGEQITVPLHKFKWHESPGDEQEVYRLGSYLTLGELSEQFYKNPNNRGVILTVIEEEPLQRTIYQIGNDVELVWCKHGTTLGFA